jgi:hypothetical protein
VGEREKVALLILKVNIFQLEMLACLLPIFLYMAAVGYEAIKTTAKYCDGLITVTKAHQSRETSILLKS